MVERVQKYLCDMFKGACVSNRRNVYNMIEKQIPFVKVTLQSGVTDTMDNVTLQSGVTDTMDNVTLDFGGIECQYRFVWSSSSNAEKERLSDIVIVDFKISNRNLCLH